MAAKWFESALVRPLGSQGTEESATVTRMECNPPRHRSLGGALRRGSPRVEIAIVELLASLLSPAMLGAREAAGRACYVTTPKQIGIATLSEGAALSPNLFPRLALRQN